MRRRLRTWRACCPSETRHVAFVSSGHGASSLQQSQPCALPTSSLCPMYQYGLAYHIERDGMSTQSYTARQSWNVAGLRWYSPSLSALTL